MPQVNRKGSLAKSRREIADKARELRRLRGWTQAELAKRLQLSQNRLSEIESGDGSFTAEQFLLLLRLFNVAATDFVRDRRDRDLEIQMRNSVDGDHRNRSIAITENGLMAITENGSSRSVVRPIRP